jgi:hypothetical protein
MNVLLIGITSLKLLLLPGQHPIADSASPDSATIQKLKAAYAFGVPLVLVDLTRRKLVNADNPHHGFENSFTHLSFFPDASFKLVVRANADTYYSTAFLDLTKEPITLSVPDTKGRYYMMPMMDAYTNVFASPGKRTTGTAPAVWLITGPQWTGAVPAGMQQIKAPTNMVWILGRTQVNSREDGQQVVVPLQKQYVLAPLSQYGKPFTPVASAGDSSVTHGDPNSILRAMPIDVFFNYLNQLMVNNPPSAADAPAMAQFATIGVKPGGVFDLNQFDPAVRAFAARIPAGFAALAVQIFSTPDTKHNGWKISTAQIGNLGTDYKARAIVAYNALGANLPEDAIYPTCAVDADGQPFTGANNYVLHFDKGETPPVNAFWSLTLYDQEGYMVANPINRNAIGDRSGLKPNADGSLDIYIQHDSPGPEKEANWLPAPADSFNLLLRIYWPKEEVLHGGWIPPAVQRLGK